MENNISEIEKKLQNYVNTNTDGDELVLSGDFKIFFLRTIVDNQYISENIKKSYFESTINFDQYIYTIGTLSDLSKIDDILLQLTEGFIIAIYKNKVFQITGALKREKRELFELTNEISFEGSTESFNEECNININLIRKYYRSINLVASAQSIGIDINSSGVLKLK